MSSEIDKYRRLFKKINVFILWMWRLGFRKWMNICPPIIGRIMVITHIGRKSGLTRRTPVNYTIIENQIYCMAGFGTAADWYQNMLKTPQIEIWLPNSWWQGTAEEVVDNQKTSQIMRQLIKDSGFAGLMFGLNAYKMSDEQILAATKNYRLMRILHQKRMHGRGGPGDLAWVWLIPIALTIIFIVAQNI